MGDKGGHAASLDEKIAQPSDDNASVADNSAKPNDNPEHSDQAPGRKIKGFRWVIVIISILSSVTLYSLDNTIVADIQPDIIDEFGELDKLPWLSVAFLVACVATNSIWFVELHPMCVWQPG